MSKTYRIPFKEGNEYDVLTKARKYYAYTQRSGVCAYVKTKYNRRVRRFGKQELQREKELL